MLKLEAQKSGEAVLKIAAEAAGETKPKSKLIGKGNAATAANGGGDGGPLRAETQRELDEEIAKLRGLLVRWTANLLREQYCFT